MTDRDKKLIEDNWSKIEFAVKVQLANFNIPKTAAEDYSQTGYLALCRKAHKYDGSTQFITFANMVIRNAFIDKYRIDKAKKMEFISLDDSYVEDDEGNKTALMEILATKNSTENEVLTKVTNDMVKKYIKNAKNKCTAQTTVRGFDALELKMEGYSGEEIASMFNVPSNSLRSWMSKAKRILLSENEFVELIRS